MRGWYGILLACVLSGCASSPTATVARPAQLELAAFVLNGRISISHQGERHSAGLHWNHKVQSDELLLLAPLGQTAARIYRDAESALLDDGDKKYVATNVELLMQQVLGWHLPLNGLHHWALGMADTESPARIERDVNGRIIVLYQDGWEVRYLRFADDKPDSLPARLQLSHDNLQLQLLIDDWEWQ